MKPTIRLYSCDPIWLKELSEALLEAFPDLELSEGSYTEDLDRSKELWPHDLLICDIDEASERAFKFIGRIIQNHGAYTYLGTLVVGAERAPERIRKRISNLGATRYMRSGRDVAEYVNEAQTLLQQLWWHNFDQLDLFALVLDKEERIVRATSTTESRFGNGLLGRTYARAIEDRPDDRLPNVHPVATALAHGEGVSEDYEIRRKDSPDDCLFLFCSPLRTTGGNHHGLAVLMEDLSRDRHIVDAVQKLSDVSTWDELYRSIVKGAQELDFARARLYEYCESTNQLTLQSCGGYPAETAAKIEKQFTYRAWEDSPTQEILDQQRKTARLYYHDADKDRRTALVSHYRGEPNFAVDLGKKKVRQWIDAPLWLPPDATHPKARLWGKLSVDQGESEQRALDPRDASQLGAYSIVVSQAIGAFERVEREKDIRKAEQKQLELVRRRSQEVVAAAWHDQSLEQVLDRSLHLFGELTGADLVVYREPADENWKVLRRVGKEVYLEEELRDRWMVPTDLSSRGLKRYLKDLRRLEEPQSVHNPQFLCQELKRELPAPADPREIAYLNEIQSELLIPVFHEGSIRGVIIAVSRRRGAFQQEMSTLVKQWMYIVSSWLEMARQTTAKAWTKTVLKTTLPLLKELADVPLKNEDGFFSGLATLLSAPHGAGWDRVWILGCDNQLPGTAQLLYAMGGYTHQFAEQIKLQDALAEQNLSKEMLHDRIENPEPQYRSGEIYYSDPLYQQQHEMKRIGAPFKTRLRYPGDYGLKQSSDPEASSLILPTHWTENLETEEASMLLPLSMPAPFEHIKVPLEWSRQYDSALEGWFATDRQLIVYPIWSSFNEPLGCVLLDRCRPNTAQEEQMLEVTQILLNLVANLWTHRFLVRRLRGWHRALPQVFHGRPLRAVWESFRRSLKRMLDKISPDISADLGIQNQLKEVGLTVIKQIQEINPGLSSEIEDCLSTLQARIGELEEKVKRLEEEDSDEVPVLTDIPEQLHRLVDKYQSALGPRIQITLRIGDRLSHEPIELHCDPILVEDAIGHLLHNSADAAVRDGILLPLQNGQEHDQSALQIDIEADLADISCPGFDRVLRISVTDSGRGVPRELEDYIFIRGVTSEPDSENHGRGLTMVRAQLSAFYGDISMARNDEHDAQGARFVIHFGAFLSHRNPTGASDVRETVDR